MSAQIVLIERGPGDLIGPIGAGIETGQSGFHIFEITVDGLKVQACFGLLRCWICSRICSRKSEAESDDGVTVVSGASVTRAGYRCGSNGHPTVFLLLLRWGSTPISDTRQR
jgi:hypothetical protein